MVRTSTVRSWWAPYRCLNHHPELQIPITLFGRNTGYCARPAHTPFLALEQTIEAHGYHNVSSVWIPRNCPAGIGGRICQPDGSGCTLHNYCVAVDIDPFGHGNDYFRDTAGRSIPYAAGRWDFDDIKLTRSQVEAAERILNTVGEQMFRWLGWPIGDTMHFEFQVPPSRTQIDWDTVPEGEVDMALKNGDKGNAVRWYQKAILGWNPAALPEWGADSDFGDETEEWVRRYQKAAELEETGQIGSVTDTLLARYHPDNTNGSQGPAGPAGTTGPAGPAGPRGPQGDPGADGTDGADASLTITGTKEL